MNENLASTTASVSPQQQNAGSGEVLLRVRGLRTTLYTDTAAVRAIDGIDLDIRRGETFALVGESGCGKSMTALSITRLLPENGRIEGGSVELDGVDLLGLSEAQMRDIRGRRIAMIFQEPATSLNPVLTVGYQIAEVIERHTGLRGAAVRKRAIELLDAVGIADSARRIDEYPFQLSGGMKQRVMIAIALAADPDLLIADEPTTALDVIVQRGVIQLLSRIQREEKNSLVLVTHDMGVHAHLTHRIVIMYAGKVIEEGSTAKIFSAPQHPYTQYLIGSLPVIGDKEYRVSAPGNPPRLDRPLTGCRFVDRCPKAMPQCRQAAPALVETGKDHKVACFLVSPEEEKESA